MIYKKFMTLLTVILFVTALVPAYAQNEPASPTKFDMKKDGDGDGVKNKRDKCPSTPPGVLVDGTGCPVDTDKDGVDDYLDKCPSIPGTVDMNGCQDKDKDGVSDIDDNCADVPGIARFKGCPDSDGDGVEDAKDKCPNALGLDMFQGCPDTDGDGIEDANDKCPDTKKGVKADANGCAADSDKDGIVDGEDKCAGTTAGTKVDRNGCPEDSDKDGIVDGEDKCAGTTAGTKVDRNGCPADTDSDGVLDINDKCPNIVGEAVNNGCPVVKKEAPKRLKFATRKISFDSKGTLVKVSSYPMLDEVASILNEYPDYNLKIGGHTDALEKDGNTLSVSRVDAVKSYLLGKNVPESRVITTGFGKTRPATTNVNATGRALNRRVELELYLR